MSEEHSMRGGDAGLPPTIPPPHWIENATWYESCHFTFSILSAVLIGMSESDYISFLAIPLASWTTVAS